MQRHGQGRRREHLKELKTQERIGAGRLGNTRRLDARTHTQLNPLKLSRSDLSQPYGPHLRMCENTTNLRQGRGAKRQYVIVQVRLALNNFVSTEGRSL